MRNSIRAFLPAIFFAAFAVPAGAQTFETIGIRAQGMGGAFVAIADDATAGWWNPAGLASGAYFNTVLEQGRAVDPSRSRASGFSLAFPALGLGYYRLQISEIRPSSGYIALYAASRQDQGVLSDF